MKEYEDLDKRLALLEQKLDLVLNNHLHHMERDLSMMKKILGAVALVVFTQLIAIVTMQL
jgi:hypothetical protein